MAVVKIILMIAAAIWFAYALLNKPKQIAVLLFVCVIADINFDMPGLPLNFRSFVALALLVKVLNDAKYVRFPAFLTTSYGITILVFVVYALAITFENGLLTSSIVKEYFFTVVYAYLAYFFYLREGGYKIFALSIIIAGFSCLGDLIWTYMQGSELRIVRIYFSFTPAYTVFNHNFFGYICAVTFVFLLSDYLADHGHKRNLYMMPFMFFGVLLSTSRSALLILIIVAIVLIAKGLLSVKNSKKAYRLIVVTVSCLVLALFLFQFLTIVFHIDSKFMEIITARLIDEPVAIFNRAMGNSFKAESLDSMDWRAKASEVAYNAYMKVMNGEEQIFGIGHEGFMARDYGDEGYDAHNGVLLMFIEFGMVGAVIYFSMLFSFIARYWNIRLFSPVLVCLIYVILYITSHNRELISGFVYLITGSLAAELRYISHADEEFQPEEPVQISRNNI
ncbi:MAG: O-antigen ligase family protein [Chitinophagaceae bacterium]|nr:O-antigen ligase family protein [Chitinophagaceae bacterium]